MSDEKWLTYEQAKAVYGILPGRLRRLVTFRKIRTKRENQVQLFEAGDIEEATGAAPKPTDGAPIPPAPPPPAEAPVAKPKSLAPASPPWRLGSRPSAPRPATEQWVDWQELMDDFGITRGWLDKQIQEERVRWRAEGDKHVYCWEDIQRLLSEKVGDALLHRDSLKL